MSFFEPPPPAPQPPAREPQPEPPAWQAPPESVLGVPVAQSRILARTESVTIALADVVAYPTGCTFELRLAGRRTNQTEDEWWDLNAVFFEHRRPISPRGLASGALPVELLRVGVEFADGRKATNVGGWPPWDLTTPPDPPVLVEAGGGGGSGGDDRIVTSREFWLWPLPPAERFALVIEWPFAGVPLTRAELDGAAIVAAAEHAEPLWPKPT